MKTYQIAASNDCVKINREEINCDYIVANGDVITFYDKEGNNPLIIYRLAPGEAVLFVGEE